MTLTYQQEAKKNSCIKKLRRTQKFELINRLLCYACVIPFFHAASCVEQKEIPVASGAGAIGFVLCLGNTLRLQNKQEKLAKELSNIRKLEKSYC